MSFSKFRPILLIFADPFLKALHSTALIFYTLQSKVCLVILTFLLLTNALLKFYPVSNHNGWLYPSEKETLEEYFFIIFLKPYIILFKVIILKFQTSL